MAAIDSSVEPPASTVERSGLPSPPVVADEVNLVIVVKLWTETATPPPAINARTH